jgi:hypothetical protein
LSGSGGIPGPPIILLHLSSPLPMVTTRATTVAFFLGSSTFQVDLMNSGSGAAIR